ncbi:MAG TPA: hypothetical protein VET69_15840 [Terriglobales bacterium]|nr:hypothetical protein [Terriglobales bacterium]
MKVARHFSQDEEVRSVSYPIPPDPVFNERPCDTNLFDLPPPQPEGRTSF